MNNIAQRIKDTKVRIEKLCDQLYEHIKWVDDDNPDEAAMDITEELNDKIEVQQRHLEMLKKAERCLRPGALNISMKDIEKLQLQCRMKLHTVEEEYDE